MGKILKSHKINNFEKTLDYSKVSEFSTQQIGDGDLETWELYQRMSSNNPVNLLLHIGSTKMTATKTNLRSLEAHLDGDWYYLLQDLLGNYIEKIKPGRTSFESNLNGKEVKKYFGELAHIHCGQSEISNFGVRISTCMYNNGGELQIPNTEVDQFKYADYYFFENKGLFLLFNIKKFEQLPASKKWLVAGQPTEYSEKRFANTSFSILYLIKFGCIDQYGYCDGDSIYKGKNVLKTSLKYDTKGNLKPKYKSFPEIWMRGCKSTLQKPKYVAYLLSNDKDTKEVIKSQTIAGIVENFTDKNGKKLTRQAFSAQARTNYNNYTNKKIPQKLSISYVGKKPYFLINIADTRISENNLKNYVNSIKEDLELRKETEDITTFLLKRSLEQKKAITKYTMSIDDYFDYVEWKHGIPMNSSLSLKLEEFKLSDTYEFRKNVNNNYYKSTVAFNANRKRGFISKKEIDLLKIEILSGDNFSNYDYYKIYKKIKENKLEKESVSEDTKSYYYNTFLSLDKNKSFSYLKTIAKKQLKIQSNGES